MNNVALCFIIPPPLDRPHSSWRGIVYVKEMPEKVFAGRRNLPSKIVPDEEIMKQEICDPDHIPAHIVQVTAEKQYIYIEGDVCEIIGTEIHIADGHNDPYLKGGQPQQKQKQPAQKKSSLILPGQPGNQASGPLPSLITTSAAAAAQGASGPISLEDRWIVDVTFKDTPVSDPAICDEVKQIAWSGGLKV